jgi:pantoate--beta-alanine ligase
LFNIIACYQKGITDCNALYETAFSYLDNHHSLEYLEFRDAENLEEKTIADNNTIVFIALKIGNVRLIDNISLGDL